MHELRIVFALSSREKRDLRAPTTVHSFIIACIYIIITGVTHSLNGHK